MSTGGENEGVTVGGVDLPVRVVRAREALADLAGLVHDAEERGVNLNIRVDVSQGMGVQIGRAVEEVREKLRLSFSGNILPTADIQSLEASLRQIIAITESGGQKISASLSSGLRGGMKTGLSGMDNIDTILAALQQHMPEIASGKMKFSLSGRAYSDESYAAAVQAAAGIFQPPDAPPEPRGRQLPDPGLAASLQAEREVTIERQANMEEMNRRLRRGSMTDGMDIYDAQIQKEEQDAESVERAHNLNELARESEAAAKAMSKAGKGGNDLASWLEAWAGGGRPQRAFGAMLQGPLTAMFGPTLGALGAGAGAMIGGGMAFHVGWEIINQLGKIPERIAQVVGENQSLDIARAGLAGRPGRPGELSPIHAATLSAAEKSADEQFTGSLQSGMNIFNRIGNSQDLGNKYVSIMETLQLESNKQSRSPLERRAWIARNSQYAKMATIGHLYAGMDDPLQTANALRELGWTDLPGVSPSEGGPNVGAAAMTLLKQPGIRKAIADAQRSKLKLGSAYTDEGIAATFENSAAELVNSPVKAIRDRVRGEIFNVVNSMVQSKDAQGQFQTATGQNHAMIAVAEWMEANILGSGIKLGREERDFLTQYKQIRGEGKSEDEALAYLAPPTQTYPGRPRILNYDQRPRLSTERERELARLAEGYRGDLGAFIGQSATPFSGLPLPNPHFSFSSLAGFANKMQTEASMHMTDFAEKTASATEASADTLARIEQKLSVGATW